MHRKPMMPCVRGKNNLTDKLATDVPDARLKLLVANSLLYVVLNFS